MMMVDPAYERISAGRLIRIGALLRLRRWVSVAVLENIDGKACRLANQSKQLSKIRTKVEVCVGRI
jgi:hypothetical protein